MQVGEGCGQVAVSRGVFSAPYRGLTVGVVLAVGLVAFESLGVATVLPEIAHRLHGLHAYGWGLSALMLAQIVGAVAAGGAADRHGPARPLAWGLLAFAAGCALGGAAQSWPVFLAGRFTQGLGVGVVMGMAYALIGSAYPQALRARMFALLSSAWTVPSLIGPTLAAEIAAGAGWRGVFMLLLPLIAVAAVLTVPSARRTGRTAAQDTADETDGGHAPGGRGAWEAVVSSVLLAAGTGLLVQAPTLEDTALLTVLAIAGLAVAVTALRRVTPAGTLTARRGVGAGVATRFLLCAVYFGSEAFLPLGLTDLRGVTATEAGLALSAGALTWVLGSALQARRDGAGAPAGRARGRTGAVATGWALLLAGEVIMAAGVLAESIPPGIAIAGWAVGGVGMGVAFNAATTDTMERAGKRIGEVSGALQLAQTLATALISGLGGAAIARGETRSALLATFALTATLAVLGVLLTPRLREPAE
ncbi:MFS transporter [Actinoallomurus sp. NPDC052308]|uniref:MFS transporter n=1 Tax=Actinoallomurus sp. NPDC052308 TaxID=3155530 RepID=UPI00343B4792